MNCDYCHGAQPEGATRCAACGAPLDRDAPPPDYRACPFCRRRLVALASPACNYCGRALPESYVKARQRLMTQITEASGGDAARREELEGDADDALKLALKSLFDLEDKTKKK
jgi:hypothetical protein